MPFKEVTPTQASALTNLKTALQPSVKDFACKGVVPLSRLDIQDLQLYFQDPNGSLSKLQFPLPKEDEDSAIKSLLDAAVPSSFGRGKEDVFDPEYRLAKEIKPPAFATSPDLLSCSGILSILNPNCFPASVSVPNPTRSTCTARAASSRPIGSESIGEASRAKRWCLARHQSPSVHEETPEDADIFGTPKSSDHVGTITFCLPSQFVGGELVVRHAGETLTCNWADEVLGEDGPKAAWAFLFSDCEHEVLPVLSGTRITIAFDLYVESSLTFEEVSFSRFENRQAALEAALKGAMGAEALWSAGKYLGLALSHDYPSDVLVRAKCGPPIAMLKGVDAILVKAIEAVGYKWEYVAVHETYSSEPEGDFKDEFLVSGSVLSYEGHNEEYGELEDVELSEEIIWVQPPRSYPVASDYVAYGNESYLSTMYSTWAIKVYIPEEDTSRARRTKRTKRTRR